MKYLLYSTIVLATSTVFGMEHSIFNTFKKIHAQLDILHAQQTFNAHGIYAIELTMDKTIYAIQTIQGESRRNTLINQYNSIQEKIVTYYKRNNKNLVNFK